MTSIGIFSLLSLVGCTYETINQYYVQASQDSDTGTPADSSSDVEIIPSAPNCAAYVDLADLPLDLWVDGNRYTFTVSAEQREEMESSYGGDGDQYGFEDGGTYADNIEVQPAGSDTCSNTGQVGVELAGESSWREWDSIPNIHIDTNDFQEELTFPSGDKALRLNNGQAESGIIREYVATKIWRALYYGPESSFAIVESNIWDEDFGNGSWAAETAVQPYKGRFFTDNLPTVTNVWEGTGDFNASWGWGSSFECQWSNAEDDTCDESVLQNAMDVISAAPYGEGFKEATESVINWEAYWTYQCVTNLTGVWDNYSHNWNNVVAAFHEDGTLILLPYSTDISGEHPWYGTAWYGTDFDGNAYIPAGCSADVENCLVPELEYCRDVVIPAYRTLNVNETIVEAAWQSMNDLDIVRDGDESQYNTISTFYSESADRVEAQVQELIDCYDTSVMYGGGWDTGGSWSPCGGSDTGF